MEIVIYLSLVTASISFTISESRLFKPLWDWMNKYISFLSKLLSCGYCTGYWVAFILVAIYRPRLFEFWWLLDYFFTALIIAWIGAFQWLVMCWFMQKVGK